MVSGGTVLPVVIGCVAALGGVAMLRSGYVGRKKAKRTESAEPTAVRDAGGADRGRVSIAGTVTGAERSFEAAVADGSGPVVVTEAETYNSGPSGDVGGGVDVEHRTGGSYDVRQEYVQAAPFTVEDDTGSVRVDPGDSVETVVEPTGHVAVDGEGSLSPAVAELVDEAGDDILIGSQTDRLSQGVVSVGDDVVVQGVTAQSGGDLSLVDGDVPVLVSDRSLDETVEAQSAGGIPKYVVGSVLVVLGVGAASIPFVVG